jgi:hypothetical protein
MNQLARGLLMYGNMNCQQAFHRVIAAASSGCVVSTQTKVPAYPQAVATTNHFIYSNLTWNEEICPF